MRGAAWPVLRCVHHHQLLSSSATLIQQPRLSALPRSLLHTSTPPALQPHAGDSPPLGSPTDTSSPVSHPNTPTKNTPSSPGSGGSYPPSAWYPSSPTSQSSTSLRRLRRRHRNADPCRPPLYTLACIDPTTRALSYVLPPPLNPPRHFELHVPEQTTVCSFRIVHAAKEYIHQAALVFEEQAHKLNLYLKAIVPLPTSTQSWTMLRSPHVDKQAREQLEIKRHKRLVTIQLDEQRRAEEEAQILKLIGRCTGMISERVTVTYRVPAGVEVHTMTFRGKEGLGEGRAKETDPVWEAEMADVNPYEEEDEDFELTDEEADWGEDLEVYDDAEKATDTRA